mmetsp:Transcript_18786/g.53876  ORF Transcript_18786/g.53876 Transcript_18786/m.53876 type:complete len:203 (-) Transcript_18786:211-819(-)
MYSMLHRVRLQHHIRQRHMQLQRQPLAATATTTTTTRNTLSIPLSKDIHSLRRQRCLVSTAVSHCPWLVDGDSVKQVGHSWQQDGGFAAVESCDEGQQGQRDVRRLVEGQTRQHYLTDGCEEEDAGRPQKEGRPDGQLQEGVGCPRDGPAGRHEADGEGQDEDARPPDALHPAHQPESAQPQPRLRQEPLILHCAEHQGKTP